MLTSTYATGFWGTAYAAKLTPHSNETKDLYKLLTFSNVSLMHYTDVHAQLLPIYYSEPDTHVGTSAMTGEIPH